MDVGNDRVGACNIMLQLRNVVVNIGDNSVGVCDIMLDVGNDGVGIGNDYVSVDCEFCLEVGG